MDSDSLSSISIVPAFGPFIVLDGFGVLLLLFMLLF
jgi:hypothetical protein